MLTEQRVLRISIIATVIVACMGIALGLTSRSSVIIFDGMYALFDAGMTTLTLTVANLIARSAAPQALSGYLQRRFNMGFWHLEPMVLGLNGTLLLAVCVYAFINALSQLLNGGSDVHFDVGMIYAICSLIICLLMQRFCVRANRRLQSDFIKLDAQAWLMSAGITAALLLSFCAGLLLRNSPYQHLTPYIDPAALAIIALILLPLPLPLIKQALTEVFLMTPLPVKAHIDAVANAAIIEHGFLDYYSYVAKTGRALHIELCFIVPDDYPAKRINDWDALRHQLAAQIGHTQYDRWLTIVFTADRELAD